MTDHVFETTTLILSLSSSELARAARLGGLPIALDDHDLNDPETSIELVRFFAKRGIAHAIDQSFARDYPARYPDDIEPSFWQTKTDPISGTGGFGQSWRGKVSW